MKLASVRKKGDVHVAVGIRIDRTLADAERSALARACTSSLLRLTSWNSRPEASRAYALATGEAEAAARFCEGGLAEAGLDGEATLPPRVALELRTSDSAAAGRLQAVFGGRGAPAGLADVALVPDGVLLEFDDRRTSLELVMAAAGVALGRAQRRAAYLRPLGDASLARIAARHLGLGDLTERRIVEYYLDAPSLPAAG